MITVTVWPDNHNDRDGTDGVWYRIIVPGDDVDEVYWLIDSLHWWDSNEVISGHLRKQEVQGIVIVDPDKWQAYALAALDADSVDEDPDDLHHFILEDWL